MGLLQKKERNAYELINLVQLKDEDVCLKCQTLRTSVARGPPVCEEARFISSATVLELYS